MSCTGIVEEASPPKGALSDVALALAPLAGWPHQYYSSHLPIGEIADRLDFLLNMQRDSSLGKGRAVASNWVTTIIEAPMSC